MNEFEKQREEQSFTAEERQAIPAPKKWRGFMLLLLVVFLLGAFVAGPAAHWLTARVPSLSSLPGLSLATSGNNSLGIDFAGDDETQTELAKLRTIYNDLKNNYYRELTDAEMIRAMYDGMTAKMDSPYTFYLSPEENAEVEDSMKGEYSGIGAQVSQQNGRYLISDIFEGSPAETAGLHIGDVFIKIGDKEASKFKDVSQLAAEVRGEDGTELSLTVYRPSEDKELTFAIKRGKIQNSNLHSEKLEDGIGYIRISQFNTGVAANFIEAVEKLRNEGAETFIFDLRHNGGGYVSEVTAMLDYLLPKGVIAVAKGRSEGQAFEESWDSTHEASIPESMRYTVLINKYSASASELFAGCLRDYDKAVLVGESSFGKGVGSITEQLRDGSALQITNFHYYLPKGDCVQGLGLAPMIPVELPEELVGLPISQMKKEADTQLQAALDNARDILSGHFMKYEPAPSEATASDAAEKDH